MMNNQSRLAFIAQTDHLQTTSKNYALHLMMKNRGILIGGTIILIAVLMAIFADLIAPADPNLPHAANKLQPPGLLGYILGSDELGRDIASRLIYGVRLSLGIGFLAALMASTTGLVLGTLSGYFGGWFDSVVMRIMDIMLAFPYILLPIVIVAVIGPGLFNTLLAVAVLGIPFYVRVTRAAVLTIKERDYITAARVTGCTQGRIVFRGIIPNVLSPVITAFSLDVGVLILEASSLSFLGLGAQPPTAEWGAMLSTGRQYFMLAPHIGLLPGLCIFILVLACNLFGDGLRDVLDPRLRIR